GHARAFEAPGPTNPQNCYRARFSVVQSLQLLGSAAGQSVEKPLVRGGLWGSTGAAPRFAGWATPVLHSSFARREIVDYSSAVHAPSSHRFSRAARDRPCRRSKTRRVLRRRLRVRSPIPGVKPTLKVTGHTPLPRSAAAVSELS